jgi:hypothetical protein
MRRRESEAEKEPTEHGDVLESVVDSSEIQHIGVDADAVTVFIRFSDDRHGKEEEEAAVRMLFFPLFFPVPRRKATYIPEVALGLSLLI